MYKLLPGIYMIRCTANGDRYIGSAKSILRRKSDHLCNLRIGKHHSKHLQNVYNKYGEASLEFLILEIVDDCSRLLEREQYWIDKLKPEINKAAKAESGFLGLRHSKETRLELSRIQKQRMKSTSLIERLRAAARTQNLLGNNGMKGKHLSEEQKQKLRELAQKQYSTPESRQKHSEIMRNWCTPEMRERISKVKTGKKLSAEHAQKIGERSRRAWENYTEEERRERHEKMSKAVVLAKAKHYKGFVAPDGTIYRDVYNLAEFCRKHNLMEGEMSALNSGKALSHRGWRLLKE